MITLLEEHVYVLVVHLVSWMGAVDKHRFIICGKNTKSLPLINIHTLIISFYWPISDNIICPQGNDIPILDKLPKVTVQFNQTMLLLGLMTRPSSVITNPHHFGFG